MIPSPRTVMVTRYVTPLREGGSLPAIVEADDLGTYVLKFRGAGQGVRVLITELLAGELARVLSLPMPEIVFAQLDPILGRSEPDPEIKSLIEASAGLNLALDYLPGSFLYQPVDTALVSAELASDIVWFDAFLTNMDRTARNTNLLVWHRSVWLIDNGAALYAQYSGPDFAERAKRPFPQIRDHVLLPLASDLEGADSRLSKQLTPQTIHEVVSLIPDSWLAAEPGLAREAYAEYLLRRLQPPRLFVEEARAARGLL